MKSAALVISMFGLVAPLSGCLMGVREPASHSADSARTLVVDERTERALVEANQGSGRLVMLHRAQQPVGTTVTVHGMDAAPDAMQPLHDRAARADRDVLTFVYDDQHSSLRASARVLAEELRALRHRQAGPLSIEAHSMGARLTLTALWYLDHRVQDHGTVELSLIAPTLEGFDIADKVAFTPVVFGGIGGLRPSMDMGSRSTMQTVLDDILLRGDVTTRIYVGGLDDLVDHEHDRFINIADRLEAEIIRVANVGHADMVGEVARLGRHDPS